MTLNSPEAVAAYFDLPDPVMEKLEGLVALTRQWQQRINLIAPGTVDEIWHRHVADGVQLYDLALRNLNASPAPTEPVNAGAGKSAGNPELYPAPTEFTKVGQTTTEPANVGPDSSAGNQKIYPAPTGFTKVGRKNTWADLGSGGGFPGLVIACCAAAQTSDDQGAGNPELYPAPTELANVGQKNITGKQELYPAPTEFTKVGQITLIESDIRKGAFLRQAKVALGLPVHVDSQRIERATPCNADIVSARALAPLPALLPLVARHISANGLAVLPKGAGWAEEIEAARQRFDFEAETVASVTDPAARILLVRGITALR